MRIVGGKYRHRLIVFPDENNPHTRPTKDRIREAIFSIVGEISSFKALDLYAGSGAMGLEALSRGASFSTFVDISPLAIKAIKENIKNLQIPSAQYEIIKDYDVNALDILKSKNLKFDIVFLDPPYDKGDYKKIVDLLIEKDLLSEQAILVLETNRPINLENIECRRKREYHYGQINVYIFWR